jgi:four helix bundle protein
MTETTRGYRELIAWQKAMDLAPQVYRLVRKLPREELYGLSDQIRRAVVSVPANIAEGQARRQPTEFAHFLSIARGSLAELDTLLLLAQRLGYLTDEDLEAMAPRIVEVRRLLQGLIHKLTTPTSQ